MAFNPRASNAWLNKPTLGYKSEDTYRDASGMLRASSGAKPRLSWETVDKLTLLGMGDGTLQPSPPKVNPKKKRKPGGAFNQNERSNAQIDYSLMNQNTLLGG